MPSSTDRPASDQNDEVGDELPDIARGDVIPPALLGLSVAGLTRRRVAWIVVVCASAWLVLMLGRQVGEASAAAARADTIAAENEKATAEIAALRLELDLVSRSEYIDLAARAERLGKGKERAFMLAPGAPTLPPDAPGSASSALGAEALRRSPLETWLGLLFGPTG